MYLITVHKILIQRVRLLASPLSIQAFNGWMKNLSLKIFLIHFFKMLMHIYITLDVFSSFFFKQFQILAVTIIRNEELKTE